MRIRTLVTALAALLLTAAPAAAFREARRPAGGVLLGAGRDGRSVLVGYAGGGCAYEATPTVHETARSVRIALLQRVAIPEGDHEACTRELRIYRLRVGLRAPLAGRRVVLDPASRMDPLGLLPVVRFPAGWATAVPRLIGLAPADAARLLRAGRVPYRIRCRRTHRPRPTVIAQSPAPPRLLLGPSGRPRRMTLDVSCGRR